eukprot:3239297-Prymnesium_polylepis.1
MPGRHTLAVLYKYSLGAPTYTGCVACTELSARRGIRNGQLRRPPVAPVTGTAIRTPLAGTRLAG